METKEQIERIALEVAAATRCGIENKRLTFTPEGLAAYACEFLARVDADRGKEVVAFRWRRSSSQKWNYETHETLIDLDAVKVMQEAGNYAESLFLSPSPQPCEKCAELEAIAVASSASAGEGMRLYRETKAKLIEAERQRDEYKRTVEFLRGAIDEAIDSAKGEPA